jgi:hypothetical protein
VTRRQKFISRLLSGSADADIRFHDLLALLRTLGFDERVRGDHHIMTKDGVPEILNLQPRGDKAKPYQVKQIRKVLTAYGFVGAVADDDNDQEEKTA